MSAYTKGPWKVMRRANQTGTKCVAVVSIPAGNVPVADMSIRSQDYEANALLIAAAPELLDGCNALLGLLELVSANPDVPQFVKELLNGSHRKAEAEAAVAKAVSQ